MPSWKKVVIDGTSPSFSQVTTTDITASGNISSSGTGTFGNLSLPDNGVLNVGTGNDLQIKQFNDKMAMVIENLRDFVILHYQVKKNDTELESMHVSLKQKYFKLQEQLENVRKENTSLKGTLLNKDIESVSIQNVRKRLKIIGCGHDDNL